MKICLLTQWMDTYGGLQKVVCDIANALSDDSGFDVTICALDRNKIYYTINENVNVDYKYDISYKRRSIIHKALGYLVNKGILRIKNNNILREIYFPKNRIIKLQEYLSINKYGIVIAVSSELTMYLCLVDYNCKKIGWQHNEYDAYFRTKGKYSYGLENLAKHLYKNLNENIVLTSYMALDYKNKMGIESTIIYNPLRFSSSMKSKQYSNNLLFVGRLAKHNKGLDYLMDILSKLKIMSKSWMCIIVGDGEDRKFVENKINECCLESNVSLVGEKDNVINYYLDSSILINTSRWEGFGLTIIEAMECGVVPISFNHDGGKELIENNKNGVLVNKFDTKQYASEINELFINRERRLLLAKASIEKAKEFDINIIINRWKEVLSK